MPKISRKQWGAKAPTSPRTKAGARRGVMIHHTTGAQLGADRLDDWVRNIQRFHQDDRGWADIGYNVLVDRNGTEWEGRGLEYVGAHCPGYNATHVGIAYLGDGDTVTPAALATIASIAQRVGGEKLVHSDGKPTACPGDKLRSWVKAGMPVSGPSASSPTRPTPTTPVAPGVAAPAFPLPRGWYFGPLSGPLRSVSGFRHRRRDGKPGHEGLRAWQARMRARGWTIDADGRYGDQTAAVARAFQAEKRLAVDGLIGAETWAAAWRAPVTR